MSPLICDCLLSVDLLVIYIMCLYDFIAVLYDALVKFITAYFLQLWWESFEGETQCALIAWNEHYILIILFFLLNDVSHVFVHVSADQNIDPVVFGCPLIFLRLKVILNNANMTQFFYTLHLLLAYIDRWII